MNSLYLVYLILILISWSIIVIVRLPGNQWKLQDVTAPRHDIIRHINPHKATACCLYTLVFVRIKQTRYDVLISELKRC